MENTKNDLELLFEKAADYIETKFNLLKLQTVDKAADVISSLICILVIVLIFLVFFFTINIGLALWIGTLLGKAYYGFFIISAFYVILGSIIYLLKNKLIKTGISNLIIKKLLK
ncbi:MAG TPA: hypothetical protein VNX01_00470 [Bacteroidia bacterium]|jgi:hypothetical protein|nr:hypothetical protein [Bacteroidia bacterium]